MVHFIFKENNLTLEKTLLFFPWMVICFCVWVCVEEVKGENSDNIVKYFPFYL